MTIYLVRHGKYDTVTGYLTSEGIEEIKILRKLLDNEGIIFDVVLTSPKDRAKETAKLLCGGVEPKEMFELSPSSHFLKALSVIPQGQDVLVVSHNPLLTGMADELGESVNFDPGTLAIFDENGLHKIITPQ